MDIHSRHGRNEAQRGGALEEQLQATLLLDSKVEVQVFAQILFDQRSRQLHRSGLLLSNLGKIPTAGVSCRGQRAGDRSRVHAWPGNPHRRTQNGSSAQRHQRSPKSHT